jgi:hypothetical protein
MLIFSGFAEEPTVYGFAFHLDGTAYLIQRTIIHRWFYLSFDHLMSFVLLHAMAP